MTSLLTLVSPLQNASAPAVAAKHTTVVGVSAMSWGKGGSYGQGQEEPRARTGGATPRRNDEKKKPKAAETYSFTEVSRTVEEALYQTSNGVVVKFPRITTIVFEGPKRVRGGFKKKGSRDSDAKHDKQLYRFQFNADPFHRIVAIRVHGNP